MLDKLGKATGLIVCFAMCVCSLGGAGIFVKRFIESIQAIIREKKKMVGFAIFEVLVIIMLLFVAAASGFAFFRIIQKS